MIKRESSPDKAKFRLATRAQQILTQATLVIAGAFSGIVLYLALFPSFYYMNWIVYLPLLWAIVSLVYLCQTLGLWVTSRWNQITPVALAGNNWGFILGLQMFVILLIGFKVPLYASFLLAKPELDEAVADHSDNLEEVGRRAKYYYCGIYPIEKARRRCHKKDRIYFQFRNDGESAIIYSESGVDDLCYNPGVKGHFFGNWYWIKED